MVGREAVDDVEVLPQRILILLRHQRWTNTHATRTDTRDVILRQEQVVRRYFTRDRKSARFRRFDDQNLSFEYQFLQ